CGSPIRVSPQKNLHLVSPTLAEWRRPRWEASLRLSATESVGCGGCSREDAICQHPLEIMRLTQHSNGKPMGLSSRESYLKQRPDLIVD
uniref:Uncharacterized protein n=1 Tax=Triticum urartu TaxID=4572 RepID=A0A8R7TCW4_TRIUA